jgi:hypothetical protein
MGRMSARSQKEQSLRRRIEKLSQQDKELYLGTTVDQVLLMNQALLTKRVTCSRTLLLCTKIDPIIQFFQQYAKAIDPMVQQSGPEALAWGCIRILLEVSHPSILFA